MPPYTELEREISRTREDARRLLKCAEVMSKLQRLITEANEYDIEIRWSFHG